MMFDVVGIGTVAADIIHRVDELPSRDGFAVIKETNFLPGGSGSNVITQVSRLTGKCAYIAQIGDDHVGDVVLESLRNENINTDSILIKAGGTTTNTEIVVDNQGDKFILLNLGDAFLSLAKTQVNYEIFDQSRIFFTDLLPGGPAIQGLKKAKEKGIKTIVNMQVNLATMTSLGVGKDAILDVLQYIDVFAPCREGLFDLCETEDVEQAKDYLRPYFKKILLVTLGGEGSVAFDEQDRKTIVPVAPVNVLDTTGAGDSYLGAFIYKYFIDKDNIQGAMEFATQCAAFTCAGMGARSCPVLKEIL